MNAIVGRILKLSLVAGALALGGCVTHYHPHTTGDGVYYDGGYYTPARHSRAVVDPVYYPYWSLDYFYFSYYRHPYSVVYGYDPFYRPYPGWYYGYRPGPRFAFAFNYGHWYPWYGAGFYYHYYRPWYRHRHHYHHHYYHHARPAVARRAHRGDFDRRHRGRDIYRGQRDDVRDSFAARDRQRRALDGRAPLPGERTRDHARPRGGIDRSIPRGADAPVTRERRPDRQRPEGARDRRPSAAGAPSTRGRSPGTRPAGREGIPVPRGGIRVPSPPRSAPGQSPPPPRSQPDSGRPAPPPRAEPPVQERPPAPARQAPPSRESAPASRRDSSGSRRR